jgi:hypothetical protein
MVGSAANHCQRYSEMFKGDPPEWGLKGGNGENTGYILCCKAVEFEDGSHGGGSENAAVTTQAETVTTAVATEAATPQTDGNDGSENAAATTQAATPQTTPKPTPAPTNNKPQMTEEEFTIAADEYSFAETYQPIWFAREQGWNGQTWNEADAFCKSKANDARLCPYEVYCPTGPNHLPYGGVRPESVVWAPISDSNNGWVSVSGQNTCVRYAILYLVSPSWGITGEDNEDKTRHIMCCKDPNSAVTANNLDSSVTESDSSLSSVSSAESFASDAPSATEEAAPENTSMSQEEMENLYSVVANEFKPMAFTRDRGWSGQTYTSALIFCAAHESKIPCPYEVMCPLGTSGQPISGRLYRLRKSTCALFSTQKTLMNDVICLLCRQSSRNVQSHHQRSQCMGIIGYLRFFYR